MQNLNKLFQKNQSEIDLTLWIYGFVNIFCNRSAIEMKSLNITNAKNRYINDKMEGI